MIKGFLKDTAALVGGGAVFAAGLCVFAVPNGILTGGASGIAVIAERLFKIPLGLGTLIVNIPLLAAAFFVLGMRYTLKTVYATAVFSAVLAAFESTVSVRFYDNPLLGAIYGGIFSAIGLYIIMRRSVVTGGSELLACIIQRVRPGRSISTLLLLIDGAVVAVGAAVFKSLETALYSMILIIILTITLNTLLSGRSRGALQLIVSECADSVLDCITNELRRGCTVLSADGGYRGHARRLILCAVNLRESELLRRRIFEIDRNAFIIIMHADSVCGNGFTIPEKEDIF